MRYSYPPENRHEQMPPNEILAAVESDLHTVVREDVESGELSLSATAPACSKANIASIGPGSEYWLP